MIGPGDGDADLFTVLSRLASCYAKLAGVSIPLLSLPPAFSRNAIALSSAFGNSCNDSVLHGANQARMD
jgi:hypothetical protein